MVHHRVLSVLLLKCLFAALIGTAMSVSGPSKLEPDLTVKYMEVPQQSRNSSSTWLNSPQKYNDGRDRRKRKRYDDRDAREEFTLCWTNVPLRECKEVTVSREVYTILTEHDVGDLVECFCVTEGFDAFESETKEPLFIDGVAFDNIPLQLVAKYTGDPLPDLDISFLHKGSDGSGDRGNIHIDTVCWPSTLLGECKEAEISDAELNDLLAEGKGDALDVELCSCASQGFTSVDVNNGGPSPESNTGVQTYSPPPRVTLCFFEQQTPDHGMWETEGGAKVQKGRVCKQVTVDRFYKTGKSRMQVFNSAGIYECRGGCAELGYSFYSGERKLHRLLCPLISSGKTAGERHKIMLTSGETDRPGEWVYGYHSNDYKPGVTLCFFDGEVLKGGGGGLDAKNGEHWWKTSDGGVVRKRELCKQFTMSRTLYVSSRKAPGRMEKFNEYGIYECGEGGCEQLGYHQHGPKPTTELKRLNIRAETPQEAGEPLEDDEASTNPVGGRMNRIGGGGGAHWEKTQCYYILSEGRGQDTG